MRRLAAHCLNSKGAARTHHSDAFSANCFVQFGLWRAKREAPLPATVAV
jgi:hypothetical protein